MAKKITTFKKLVGNPQPLHLLATFTDDSGEKICVTSSHGGIKSRGELFQYLPFVFEPGSDTLPTSGPKLIIDAVPELIFKLLDSSKAPTVSLEVVKDEKPDEVLFAYVLNLLRARGNGGVVFIDLDLICKTA